MRWPYPAKLVATLSRTVGFQIEKAGIAIGSNSIAGLLSGVRNRILVWATQLELAGVKGEGDLSFSKRDKELASVVTYSVQMAPGSVIGAVGQVSDQATVNTTVNQVDAIRELASLADQISRYAGQLGLEDEERAELESRASELKHELAQASPDRSKLKLLLGAIRSVAENVAGNLIATGILNTIARPEIAAFLKQIHLP